MGQLNHLYSWLNNDSTNLSLDLKCCAVYFLFHFSVHPSPGLLGLDWVISVLLGFDFVTSDLLGLDLVTSKLSDRNLTTSELSDQNEATSVILDGNWANPASCTELDDLKPPGRSCRSSPRTGRAWQSSPRTGRAWRSSPQAGRASSQDHLDVRIVGVNCDWSIRSSNHQRSKFVNISHAQDWTGAAFLNVLTGSWYLVLGSILTSNEQVEWWPGNTVYRRTSAVLVDDRPGGDIDDLDLANLGPNRQQLVLGVHLGTVQLGVVSVREVQRVEAGLVRDVAAVELVQPTGQNSDTLALPAAPQLTLPSLLMEMMFLPLATMAVSVTGWVCSVSVTGQSPVLVDQILIRMSAPAERTTRPLVSMQFRWLLLPDTWCKSVVSLLYLQISKNH